MQTRLPYLSQATPSPRGRIRQRQHDEEPLASDAWKHDLLPRPPSAREMHPPTAPRAAPARPERSPGRLSSRKGKCMVVGAGRKSLRSEQRKMMESFKLARIRREEDQRLGLEESFFVSRRLRRQKRAKRSELDSGIARLIQLQPSALDALILHHYLEPAIRASVETQQVDSVLNTNKRDDVWGAAKDGALLLVRAMLGGSDPNVHVNCVDEFGETPLLATVRAGHLDVIHYLLDEGADVSIADNMGESPLHAAAAMGTEEIVVMLLGHGANINIADKIGDTPLHAAARHNKVATVELLLARGADPMAKNSLQKTPLNVTRNIKIKDALRSAIPRFLPS